MTKINNAAAAAAAPAFVSAMTLQASKADHANLSAAAAVLIIIRDAGGTNKKAASALWALLPEDVVATFAQVKRVNGAINAPAEKASEGANTVRPLWLAAKSGKAFTDALLNIGIKSPRALLDLVAPRTEKAESAPKKAVDTFLAAAKQDGFKEDCTALLVWIAEKHAVQMQNLLEQANAFQEGVLKDAAEKQAEIEAKQEAAQSAQAEKDAKKAEKDAKKAEETAQVEKDASEAKSRKARADHAEKQARDRATHPKVRQIIEA